MVALAATAAAAHRTPDLNDGRCKRPLHLAAGVKVILALGIVGAAGRGLELVHMVSERNRFDGITTKLEH